MVVLVVAFTVNGSDIMAIAMIRVVEFSQQVDSSPDGNSNDCILIAWPIDNEYVALCIQYHELFQASYSVARIFQ